MNQNVPDVTALVSDGVLATPGHATPIELDALKDLIPAVTTRAELNVWE